MMRMEAATIRMSIRKWSMRTAVSLAIFVLAALASNFIAAYAAEKGWYSHPSEKVGAVLGAAHSVVASDWFKVIASLIVGFALGVRLDTWLKPKARLQSAETTAELKLRYPHDKIFAKIDAGMRRETEFGKKLYKDSIIDIPNLFGPSLYLDHVVFENCVIAGPAVASIRNGMLAHVNFLHERDLEELFIEITDERAKHLISCAYLFDGCTFHDCQFYRVGFIGSKAALDGMRKAVTSK